MSKKKATMTLKDFHGGSIPSDLPLPSAPGVVVRPTDRAGYDRPQWGRSDNRSRPNSASSARNLDDRTPFLGSSVHIGRNFDEDERKPLDGVSGPRRTVSDESVRGAPSGRMEVRSEPVSRQGLLYYGNQVGGGVNVNSYSGRVVGGGHESVGVQSLGVSSGQGGGGLGRGSTNAWTARKEAAMGVSQPGQSGWSVQSAASKLAHASAIEKVSSGLWQTKPSVHYQADIEVISHDDSGMHNKIYDDVVADSLGFVDERNYYDEILASRVERGLNIDDGIRGGRKEFPDHGGAAVPGYAEVRERKQPVYNEGIWPAHSDGKSAPEVHNPVPSEPSGRPKLKLLPRTKPLDNTEAVVVDHKPGHQQLGDRAVKSGNVFHGNVNSAKVGLSGDESGDHEVERPRLNLQPRLQSLGQSLEPTERERKSLFGGARPRELVLKERGIDNVVSNHEMGHPADRVKHDASKTGRIPGHVVSSRRNDKIENHYSDQRPGKKFERKDHHEDAELQKRNWRKENWRNNKEVEKQKQQQETPPSPETWRKPVEEPRPASEGGGTRIGKATSAVELAQAFSRSVSNRKMGDRNSGQRSLPGRTQIPFSRLTGPGPAPGPMPRKQINGY